MNIIYNINRINDNKQDMNQSNFKNIINNNILNKKENIINNNFINENKQDVNSFYINNDNNNQISN